MFVTTHSEFAPISYQYMVSALTFIDKGLPYEERYKVLNNVYFQYEARNKHIIPSDDFIVANSNATVRVPFHEVEYVMTDEPHRLALVTLDRIVYFMEH